MEIVTCKLLLSHIRTTAKWFKILYLNHSGVSHVIAEFRAWIVQVERLFGQVFVTRCSGGLGKSIEGLF